jgi:antibiotic biosynthesis monooxygenase (ABM) superfamily enzyme
MLNSSLRRTLVWCALTLPVAAACFYAGQISGQNKFNAPTSVLHVVTLNWKADATAEQKQKAIDGIKTMAGQVPGIKNVWVKKLRSQQGQGKEWDAVFAIEFESQAAAEAYAKHPAHDKWYEVYTPAREESRSHQITN